LTRSGISVRPEADQRASAKRRHRCAPLYQMHKGRQACVPGRSTSTTR
jgi:hypothetical protein